MILYEFELSLKSFSTSITQFTCVCVYDKKSFHPNCVRRQSVIKNDPTLISRFTHSLKHLTRLDCLIKTVPSNLDCSTILIVHDRRVLT